MRWFVTCTGSRWGSVDPSLFFNQLPVVCREFALGTLILGNSPVWYFCRTKFRHVIFTAVNLAECFFFNYKVHGQVRQVHVFPSIVLLTQTLLRIIIRWCQRRCIDMVKKYSVMNFHEEQCHPANFFHDQFSHSKNILWWTCHAAKIPAVNFPYSSYFLMMDTLFAAS